MPNPEPKPVKPRRPLILAAAVVLILLLLAPEFALVAVRRLNFDETLVLRAGWLAVEGVDGGFSFWMPWSLLMGVLAHSLEDPGHVVLAARAAGALAILTSLGFATRRQGVLGFALALLICLTQSDFVHHGMEFRYDAALITGLLVACGCLGERTRAGYVLLGCVIAWLLVHHLKGAYYAFWVLALALAQIRVSVEARRLLTALIRGFLGTLASWLFLSVAFGRTADLWKLPWLYLRVGSDVEQQGTALGTVVDNPGWWLLASLALLILLSHLVVDVRRTGDSRGLTSQLSGALGLFLASLLLALLHPASWPYLRAAPVPLLAVALVQNGHVLLGVVRPLIWAGLTVLIFGLQWEFLWIGPQLAYQQGFARTSEFQVAGMRYLKTHALPGETVLDPSGLAYFLRPCVSPWYTDTIFQPLAADGRWMSELTPESLASCDWLVATGRLGMLPPEAFAAFPETHPLRERYFGSSLRRRRSAEEGIAAPVDARTIAVHQIGPVRFESYWGISRHWQL